ncbi:MAG TPA: hypothetical protein VM537_12425, partial [Anaerolineae bacterium]|nr:hypothetical protein [Anaerolineae bacterium]
FLPHPLHPSPGTQQGRHHLSPWYCNLSWQDKHSEPFDRLTPKPVEECGFWEDAILRQVHPEQRRGAQDDCLEVKKRLQTLQHQQVRL